MPKCLIFRSCGLQKDFWSPLLTLGSIGIICRGVGFSKSCAILGLINPCLAQWKTSVPMVVMPHHSWLWLLQFRHTLVFLLLAIVHILLFVVNFILLSFIPYWENPQKPAPCSHCSMPACVRSELVFSSFSKGVLCVSRTFLQQTSPLLLFNLRQSFGRAPISCLQSLVGGWPWQHTGWLCGFSSHMFCITLFRAPAVKRKVLLLGVEVGCRQGHM